MHEDPFVASAASVPIDVALIACDLGTQRWALRLDAILRLAPAAVTPVPAPGGPSWLLGAIHLDGMIALLLDPARFLGVAATTPSGPQDQMLLLVSEGDDTIALRVTHVGAIAVIPPDDLVVATPEDRPPGQPFLAARLVGPRPPEWRAERDIAGVLDVHRLVHACLFALDREEVMR